MKAFARRVEPIHLSPNQGADQSNLMSSPAGRLAARRLRFTRRQLARERSGFDICPGILHHAQALPNERGSRL